MLATTTRAFRTSTFARRTVRGVLRAQRYVERCELEACEPRMLLSETAAIGPGPYTAGAGAPVSFAPAIVEELNFITYNEANQPLLFSRVAPGAAWTKTDLANLAGTPSVSTPVTWIDPVAAGGQTYVAGITDEGLLLASRNADEDWTVRDLAGELTGSQRIARGLRVIQRADGGVRLIGLAESGDLVEYSRGAAVNGAAGAWAFTNISEADIRGQGFVMPTLSGSLVSYVRASGEIGVVSLDDSGRTHLFHLSDGGTRWESRDITARFGAFPIRTGLAVYLTPWDGINIAGVAENGHVVAAWWVPQFSEGDDLVESSWMLDDLSDRSGGPALAPESVSSYATGWGGLNMIGVSRETGEAVQYWWSPESGMGNWDFVVLSELFAGAPSLRGSLAGAGPDGTMTVVGAEADGELVRFAFDPASGWTAENLTVAARTVWGATRIESVSPARGEEFVSVSRNAVVRFSERVDPATVTTDSFHVIANGQRVPGRIRVSQTELFATYIYDEPLPASTEVRVMVDGSAIMGRDAIALDADGDTEPSGVSQGDFRTLPLSLIAGTEVFGYIYDSYRRNPDGSNIPVVGATLTLDALPGVSATTDENGYFVLRSDAGLPAPEFFVHIDGSTAINAPDGTVYATLGKALHSTPGQSVQINADGAAFDIFLPPMAMGDIVELPADQDAVVGFGDGGMAQLAALFPSTDPAVWERLRVTYPAGSAIDNDGNMATRATIIPVAPDRLPAPLPATVNPQLVISVQAGTDAGFNLAGGSMAFDTPAPVTFPNMDGLLPGEQSLIWSFDHEAGRWVVIGTGTVSADGLTITSDEGSGIRAPGWHFVRFGTIAQGNPCQMPTCTAPQFEDFLVGPNQPAINVRITTNPSNSTVQWTLTPVGAHSGTIANNTGTTKEFSFTPNVSGPGVRPTSGSTMPNDPIEYRLAYTVTTPDGRTFNETVSIRQSMRAVIRQEYVDFGLPVPPITLVGPAMSTANFGASEFSNGNNNNYPPMLLDAGLRDIAQQIRSAYGQSLTINSSWRNPRRNAAVNGAAMSVHLFGGAVDLDPPGSMDTVENMVRLYNAAVGVGPGKVLLENNSQQLLPGDWSVPSSPATFASGSFMIDVEDSDSDGLIDRVLSTQSSGTMVPSSTTFAVAGVSFRVVDGNQNGFIDIGETVQLTYPGSNPATLPAETLRARFSRATHVHADNRTTSFAQRGSAGPDGDERPAPYENNISINAGFGSEQQVHYRFQLVDGLTIQGVETQTDRINAVLTPSSDYQLYLYQPSTNRWTILGGTAGVSGTVMNLGTITLTEFGGDDQDFDGVPDIGEYVLGTDPNSIDSDNDGIPDAAELEQGLSPLDNRGFPTGTISALPLLGDAQSLVAENDTIYVATGSHGLAIVDASRFDNPIVQGQLDLNGSATGVGVDTALNIAAVATGSSLQLVDVSDPMNLRVIRGVGIPASRVIVVDGVAYAAAGTALRAVDLASGAILQSLTLPGSGTLTGFAREGDFLYAYLSGSDTLSVVDIAEEAGARVRGQLRVDVASADVGLFAGNGVVWLAGSGLRTVNVTSPDMPTLIAAPDPMMPQQFFTARRVALNGSGLGLLLPDGGNYVQVYDTSSTSDTDNLLTQFNLSGTARDMAISRGIGYIAVGNRLEVINYRPFDTMRQAPTVTLSTNVVDQDPMTDGVQVLEGSAVPLRVAIADDVQVRNVELLVNGQVVRNDVSFPFDFRAVAPAISAGGASLTVQIRATDTGGNVTLSDVLTLGVSPDRLAPTIASVTPGDMGAIFQGSRAVRVRFSEAIDETAVTPGNFRVVAAGVDGVFQTADDVVIAAEIQSRDEGRVVQLTADFQNLGLYRLEITQDGVRDLAGNALGTGVFTSVFDVRERRSQLVGNHVVFVIDVSGSAGDGFSGTAVGDVNGDGRANTILDAEIAAFLALNQELINLNLGQDARVSVIPFSSSASRLDMNPVTPGYQAGATPDADANGNGIRDAEELLTSLRTGGGTNFEAALQAAIQVFTDLGTASGNGNLVFMSDGFGTPGFLDEVATLESMGINRLAYGVGAGASLEQLTQIDSRASRFTSIDELLAAFLNLG